MGSGPVRLEIGNKITLLAEEIPHFYSFSFGLFINSGSRDETVRDNGITHLIEHMLFKGTERKSSFEIMKKIEALGGAFDAFTTKENVVIMSRFLHEHLAEIFDLIAEMLLESSFSADGLEREKGVILEELKTQLDDPEEYVFDLLFEALYAPHLLGYPIAGRADSVKPMIREDITGYFQRFLAQRFVVAIAGKYDLDLLVRKVTDRFGSLSYAPNQRTMPGAHHSVFKVDKRDEISQVYVAIGRESIPYNDPKRYPFAIMNTAFGGGMSSRLFQNMREKAGLVYSVSSMFEFYEDIGLSVIYFVTDKENLRKCFEVLSSVLRGVQGEGFATEELETARSFIKGNLLLGLESSTTRMTRLGRNEVLTRRIEPVEETLAQIDRVSLEDMNAVSREAIQPETFCVAAVGPIDENELKGLYNEILLKP